MQRSYELLVPMADNMNNEVHPATQAEVIDDLEPVETPPTPPRIAPPKLAGALANPIHSSISVDDTEFIGLVFSQVRHVDFRAAPAASNPRLTGIDKKLFGLREQVRKLERDLARVAFVWQQKQAEIDAAAHWVQSKDDELSRAKMRLEELVEELTQTQDSHLALRTLSEEQKLQHETDKQEASKRHQALESQIDSLEKEHEQERELWATRLTDVQREAERSVLRGQEEQSHAQRAYDALKGLAAGEKEIHGEQQQSLRLQNANLSDRIVQLEIREIEHQREIARLGTERLAQSTREEAGEKDSEALRAELAAAREEQSETEHRAASECDALQNTLEDVREQSRAQRQELERLKEESQNANRGRAEIEVKMADVSKAHQVLQEQQQTSADEHARVVAKLRSRDEHIREQHKRQLASAEEALSQAESLAGEWERKTTERDNQLANARAIAKQETEEKQGLMASVDEHRSQRDAREALLQEAQKNLRSANQGWREAEAEVVALRARLDATERDYLNLNKRLAQLE